MDKVEQAKILLRKAIVLDDPELIAIANELLGMAVHIPEDVNISTPEEIVETPIIPAPETRKSEKRDTDFHSFKMNTDEALSRKNGIAINKIRREIQFVDDGSDKDITTPEISRTDRKRAPFKKIEQQCAKCGRTVQTHPTHKREYFVCDGCIRK